MTAEAPPHPAKFSEGMIDVFDQLLKSHRTTNSNLVLDPFAGVGGIHKLVDKGWTTVGVEIQEKWANVHPRTMCGDATKLNSKWTESFDAVVTSPTYGNRMADHHDAAEKCKSCNGSGCLPDRYSIRTIECHKCGGTGKNSYKRLTYTHQYGEQLEPNNTGKLQWGDKYRELHMKAWAEVHRVLKWNGLFVINISDHIRDGKVVEVSAWHAQVIELMGFAPVEHRTIETRRMRFGANRDTRVDHENIYVFRKTMETNEGFFTTRTVIETLADDWVDPEEKKRWFLTHFPTYGAPAPNMPFKPITNPTT